MTFRLCRGEEQRKHLPVQLMVWRAGPANGVLDIMLGWQPYSESQIIFELSLIKMALLSTLSRRWTWAAPRPGLDRGRPLQTKVDKSAAGRILTPRRPVTTEQSGCRCSQIRGLCSNQLGGDVFTLSLPLACSVSERFRTLFSGSALAWGMCTHKSFIYTFHGCELQHTLVHTLVHTCSEAELAPDRWFNDRLLSEKPILFRRGAGSDFSRREGQINVKPLFHIERRFLNF